MTDGNRDLRARVWVHGPSGSPMSFPLAETTLIGRGKHCEVELDDQTVSLDHAEVRQHGASYLIVDLDSENGTVVNGKRITGSVRLRDGDAVQIGPYRLEASFEASTKRTRREAALSVELSDEELKVARALVAPYRGDENFAGRPATRQELAERLHISESTVKRRLDAIAVKLRLPADAGHERPRLIADRVIALGLDRC